MGRLNSSKTRVAPVFNELLKSDRTGRSWLPGLLQSGSRAAEVGLPEDIGELVSKHPTWWGNTERRLPAPPRLLEHLVQNVRTEAVARSRDREPIRLKRELLAGQDRATIDEALELLRGGRTRRGWHVLEGPSSPDAFLETDRIVLVVEGKRTESGCTTHTRWMEKRSQLLRHMDAALEIAEGRRVLALLMVEGDAEDGMEPSSHWRVQADEQIAPEMVRDSLPHRDDAERGTIRDGVLGVVTWQRVCRDFALPWPPVADA